MTSVKGTPLSEADYSSLEARWIDRDSADLANLRRVDTFDGRELVGHNGSGRYEGIAIPYFLPGENQIREHRLRRDHPEYESGKPKGKYLAPPGRGNMLYFVPSTSAGWLTDTNLPIVLTEGEFKAIALYRASWHDLQDTANLPRFLPIALPGVWNFRGVIGKTVAADGTRVDEKGPIPDLSRIEWTARPVTILFDRDCDSNDNVKWARTLLTRELQKRGAHVKWFGWPDEAPLAKGVDDLLAAIGPQKVLALIENAKPSDAGADWTRNLIRTRSGIIKGCLANAIMALSAAPEWDGVLAFNEFSVNTEALKPTPWNPSPHTWCDNEDILLADWLQRKGIDVSKEIASQAVDAVSRKRGFHPVRAYLEKLTWDGVPRLNGWLERYLGAHPATENKAYLTTVGARWLISAIARICKPGCKADHCLILEGPQGIGKSTALRTLAGPWFADEIGDLGSKDASMQTRGVWIMELSELDALNRSEVSGIKSFMSRATDHFRPPYGKRTVDLPRQCVFAGTVNGSAYLRDETGGRRFWPVSCESIDTKGLTRDRDQLWAEAVARYSAGESWWLDTHDLNQQAGVEQSARYDGDVWDHLILEWVEARVEKGHGSISVREVLELCIEKKANQWTKADEMRVGRCLKANRWERYKDRKLGWRYSSPTITGP